MEKLFPEKVFFRLRIEEVFSVVTGIVVTGRVACGQIHDKSDVVITDSSGLVLKRTKVKDLDWFSRRRYAHVTAGEGMNIAVILDKTDKEYLQRDHLIVIE